ncbi:MAG: glycosyltransferase [bacterium]
MVPTVIIASYNKPQYLKLVLDGYRQQKHSRFNIIVADDGSGEETRALIEREQASYPVSLEHLWHEDKGFRKCRILNKAIAASKAEYLIFTDDDCIPLPDFISSHLKYAEAKHFLSSGGMRLPESLTQHIFEVGYEGIEFSYPWLHSHGLPDRLKYKRFYWPYGARTWLDRLLPIKKTFNGNNSSAFREDIVKVGGFDERMEYHGEDAELGMRLQHAGVAPIRVRHRARSIHLEHGRGYVTDEMIKNNKAIIADTKAEKRVYSPYHVGFD